MYHVYKQGYSTLPNLKKIGADEVFEKDQSESRALQEEKREALKNQVVFLESDNDQSFYPICAKWIKENYPRRLYGSDYFDIVKETEEDFLIHRMSGERDWLSSAHVCFASHWRPEDKVGRSFEEIHLPVPMNLKNSKKLIQAAIKSGIFERFVWSVVHDDRYNFHPRLAYSTFNLESPKVLIKVERQVTVAFPENDFCLFILRQYLIKESEIDKPLLANVIESMTPEQKKYKGLSDCGDLLNYLRS